MKIDSISTKSGDTHSMGNFTILVGPNNTGKSQTLRDIHDLMSNGMNNVDTTIVTDIQFEDFSPDHLLDELELDTDPNNRIDIGYMASHQIYRGISNKDWQNNKWILLPNWTTLCRISLC